MEVPGRCQEQPEESTTYHLRGKTESSLSDRRLGFEARRDPSGPDLSLSLPDRPPSKVSRYRTGLHEK